MYRLLLSGHAWHRGGTVHDKKEANVLSFTADAAMTADKIAPVVVQPQCASSEEQLTRVLSSLTDDKAEDIVQIDLRGKTAIGDYMVICSGRSTRQGTAISEKLAERLKTELGIATKIEGKETGDWVLLDTGDVIVHVFRPEVREFYQLDKMWMPSPKTAAT